MAGQKTSVRFLHPEKLHRNPAYSPLVVVENPSRTIYIGGQNAVSSKGEIVGKGDIAAQSGQILENIKIALESAGADLDNIIKWTIYILDGQPVKDAFAIFQARMSEMKNAPLVSVVFVSGLAHPEFLLEIEAVAVV